MLTIRAITVDVAHNVVVAIDKTTSGIAMTAQETTVAVAHGVFVLILSSCVPLSLVIGNVAGVPVGQDTSVGLLRERNGEIVEIRAEDAVGTTFVFLTQSAAVVGIGEVVQISGVVGPLVCEGTEIIDLSAGHGVFVDKV